MSSPHQQPRRSADEQAYVTPPSEDETPASSTERETGRQDYHQHITVNLPPTQAGPSGITSARSHEELYASTQHESGLWARTQPDTACQLDDSDSQPMNMTGSRASLVHDSTTVHASLTPTPRATARRSSSPPNRTSPSHRRYLDAPPSSDVMNAALDSLPSLTGDPAEPLGSPERHHLRRYLMERDQVPPTEHDIERLHRHNMRPPGAVAETRQRISELQATHRLQVETIIRDLGSSGQTSESNAQGSPRLRGAPAERSNIGVTTTISVTSQRHPSLFLYRSPPSSGQIVPIVDLRETPAIAGTNFRETHFHTDERAREWRGRAVERLATARRTVGALRSAASHPDQSSLVRFISLTRQSLTAITNLLYQVEVRRARRQRGADTVSDSREGTSRNAVLRAQAHILALGAANENPKDYFDNCDNLCAESVGVLEELATALRRYLRQSDEEDYVFDYPEAPLSE